VRSRVALHGTGLRLFVAMMACVLLAACATSTKLVQSWTSPDLHGSDYRHIMVMAVAPDDVSRRAYEKAFVERLEKKQGRRAIEANALMPDVHQYERRESLQAAVRKAGADLLIITSLIAIDKKEHYIPPRFDYAPTFGMGYGYYRYSAMSMHAMYVPGHTRTDVTVRLEVTAFDVASEKMIWAGTTHSFNPSSAKSVIRENITLIMKTMQRAGIL